MLRQIFDVAVREVGILRGNHMYLFCMVLFPVFIAIFFTSLLGSGQPTDMPIGIVDQDNTAVTRQLSRLLDAFENTKIVRSYPSVSEARRAIQQNDIYAFIYVPEGTTAKLLASRQPKISFYYSLASVTSGSLLYKDLKTVSSLGSAAMMRASMRARGYTDSQILSFIQPIKIDLHQIANPMTDYNVYLSTMLVPAVLMMFIFLVTAYSLGTELKFNRSKEWLDVAGNNIWVALLGKMLPQTLVFLTVMYGFWFYAFAHLGFPHEGSTAMILLLGLLTVLASQGFGIFVFGLLPSLRMSMSICSLWAVLSFSMVGSAFPLTAMDSPLQALSVLFPLRHVFMTYQITVFNGYPIAEAWPYLAALLGFALLGTIMLPKLKNVMLTYVYIP